MSCLKQLFRWALSHGDHQTASIASDINFDLRIVISNLYYPGDYVHVAFNYFFGGLWGHGDLQTASIAWYMNFDLGFEISNLYYPGNYVHVTFNNHCGGLWGHGNLWTASMASDINFDLIFEISNRHYPGDYVHIAFKNHFGGLWGHGSLQMTSEVASDLKFVFRGLNNLCSSASTAPIVLYLTNLPRKKPNIIHRPAGFAAGKKRLAIWPSTDEYDVLGSPEKSAPGLREFCRQGEAEVTLLMATPVHDWRRKEDDLLLLIEFPTWGRRMGAMIPQRGREGGILHLFLKLEVQGSAKRCFLGCVNSLPVSAWLYTGVVLRSCLFPSMRHQSFNQYWC